MKDFDLQRSIRAEEDRSFKIGGEKFVRRAAVRPEVTQEWEDLKLLDVDATPQSDVLGVLDRTILALVEPGARNEAHKRWTKLRERDEDPITSADMLALIPWLIEEMTGRPTGPSSSYSGEPEPTGTSSTDGSSLRAVPEARTA